jgi:hypothetical protein
MQDPIELTASELDLVAGGTAVSENVSEILQSQAVGNATAIGGANIGSGDGDVGVQVAEVTQVAFSFNR